MAIHERKAWVIGSLVAVLLAGCGEGHDGASAPQEAASVDPGSINVSQANRCDFLDQAQCLFPFPNDYFTSGNAPTPTGLRLDFKRSSMPANKNGVHINPADFNRADGFSPGQAIVLKVPGLGTPQAFKNTGAVPITDIARYQEPNQAVVVIDAQTGKRWPVWAEIDQAAALNDGELTGPTPKPENTALIIRPAVNFTEGHRYIVALRNLKNASGQTIKASPAFRVYRDDITTHIPAIEARRAHMESLFRTLQDAAVDRDDLYLAWDFTVASRRSLTQRMLSIRNDAFNQLGDTDLSDLNVTGKAPKFQVEDVTNFGPCDPDGCQEGQSNRLIRKVSGTVTVPCYLNETGCPPGSRFTFKDTDNSSPGTPIRRPGNTYNARFICIIPRSVEAADGSIGAARPSLYGHGLFGSAEEVTSGKLKTMGKDYNFIFCATDWIGMSEGDIPNAIKVLQDLSKFPTLVDRLQQGFLDFLYLGRAMIHPQGFVSNPAFQIKDANGKLQPVIDTQRLFYDGGSQGSILGGSLAAVAPDFTRASLGVPGMNYSTLLRRSVDFAKFAQVLYPTYPDRLARPLILSLIQMLWDRGDTDGYAEHITADPLPDTPLHKVLMEVAYGDHQVTNWSAQVEARTLGAKIRKPLLDPGRSNEVKTFWGVPRIKSFPYKGPAAVVLADVGPLRQENGQTKGTPPPPPKNVPNQKGVDPHGPDNTETAKGQRQIAEFLKAGGSVIDTCDNHPCYLDGYTGPSSSSLQFFRKGDKR